MSEASSPSPPSTSGPSRAPRVRRGGGGEDGTPPHVAHVREHLRRLEDGTLAVPNPEEIFLGEVGEGLFQEVVGMRMEGNPMVILGAFRFRRHEFPGEEHGRESLTAYFSSPPTTPGVAYPGAVAGEVSALLPRWHERIPVFLGRLRAGAHYVPVHFPTDLIQVAFDFRVRNPSALETERRRKGPMIPHLFRTRAGHILRGNSHGRQRKRGDDHFIAVTECEQLTPDGPVRLPSIMLNRAFVAMSVPLTDERTRLAAPNWTPFLHRTGTRRHLLLG